MKNVMEITLLWTGLGAVSIVCIIGTLRWIDRPLLRAEEKGWILHGPAKKATVPDLVNIPHQSR
jgi:hypothetical protein